MAKQKDETNPVVTIESLLDKVAATDKETADAIGAVIAEQAAEIEALKVADSVDDTPKPEPVLSEEERTFETTVKDGKKTKKVKAVLPAQTHIWFSGTKHKVADVVKDEDLLKAMAEAKHILIKIL